MWGSGTDLKLKSNIYLVSVWEIIHPVLRVRMMGKLRASNQLSSRFLFCFPGLNSLSVGRKKETQARSEGGCEVGGGGAEGEKEEDEPACV